MHCAPPFPFSLPPLSLPVPVPVSFPGGAPKLHSGSGRSSQAGGRQTFSVLLKLKILHLVTCSLRCGVLLYVGYLFHGGFNLGVLIRTAGFPVLVSPGNLTLS